MKKAFLKKTRSILLLEQIQVVAIPCSNNGYMTSMDLAWFCLRRKAENNFQKTPLAKYKDK